MGISSVSTSSTSIVSTKLFPASPQVPAEVLLKIFSYLSIKDLARFQRVSKHWGEQARVSLGDISRQLGFQKREDLIALGIKLKQLGFPKPAALFMEACWVRESDEEDYYDAQAILKLPVIIKPWEEVGLKDFVDPTGRSLVREDLTLDKVKSAINPPYVLRWLLLMPKKAAETHCITNMNAAAFEFLVTQCFHAALDTLKEPNCSATYNHLYSAVSIGKMQGPWRNVNEHDELACIDIIDHFIEARRLDINQVRLSETALILAVLAGSQRIVECLINHKADVNLARADGRTPLLLAVLTGAKKIVECLIKHGADVDLVGAGKVRPLALAIMTGAKKIVECLIEQHNADVNFLTYGLTPMRLAQQEGHTEIAEYLRHPPL